MNANSIAQTLILGFEEFKKGFINLTASGSEHFANCRWTELRAAMQQRIRLTEISIDQGASVISLTPPDNANWKIITGKFLSHFANDNWHVLAISYLNACLRQAYAENSFPLTVLLPSLSAYRVDLFKIPSGEDLRTSFSKVISLNGSLELINAETALTQVIKIFEREFPKSFDHIELYPELFYRNQHAYAVGRIVIGEATHPIALAYTNNQNGITLNACMLHEDELLNIFSFSRSYFLVNTTSPAGLVNFLCSAMPNKPKAQLLMNLGFQELGKDLLVRQINFNLPNSEAKISYAEGIAGMVMLVFQHPEIDYVFKIVRSKIKPPKETTEREVTEKYRFVSQQDRVGRMADAQMFKNLALSVDLFEDKLHNELIEETNGGTVNIKKGFFIFRTIFVERKLIPLNIYIKQNNDSDKEHIIIDYGNAIKEMAITNIFAGDMLIKNFGVSDKKRVVFYDYDEVMPITQCQFKNLRQPSNYDEEMASEYPEPVFEGDIFPEELFRFLVPSGRLREIFNQHHSDLYNVDFWNHWKSVHQSGKLIDIQPYEPNIK